ncbi:MAG: hypothetical protein ABUK01_00470 [Leptospirales bacterium]
MALIDKQKNPGDMIKSQDWNDTVDEINRLDNDKVNKAGDLITGGLSVGGKLTVKDQFQIGDASHIKAFSETGAGELKIGLGKFRIGTMIQIEARIAGANAETAGLYHIVCDWNERPSILYQSVGDKMGRLAFFGYRQNEETLDASNLAIPSGAVYLWARWLPDETKPVDQSNTLYLKAASVTEFDELDTGVWETALKYPVGKVLTIDSRSGNVGIGTDAPGVKVYKDVKLPIYTHQQKQITLLPFYPHDYW